MKDNRQLRITNLAHFLSRFPKNAYSILAKLEIEVIDWPSKTKEIRCNPVEVVHFYLVRNKITGSKMVSYYRFVEIIEKSL